LIAFLRYAFIGGLLASVSFGIIGTYVVTRRISYLAELYPIQYWPA